MSGTGGDKMMRRGIGLLVVLVVLPVGIAPTQA
jgi:hypothetical protein